MAGLPRMILPPLFPRPPTTVVEPEPLRRCGQCDRVLAPDEECPVCVSCRDCRGTGWYVGFTAKYHCPTCDGSGWL